MDVRGMRGIGAAWKLLLLATAICSANEPNWTPISQFTHTVAKPSTTAGWPYYTVGPFHTGSGFVAYAASPTPAVPAVPPAPTTSGNVVAQPPVATNPSPVAPPPATRNAPGPVASTAPATPSVNRIDRPFRDDSVFRENGQYWANYDISRYTAHFGPADQPERAVREWILSETGLNAWSGREVASLSVSPTIVKAYHDAQTQHRVAEVIRRFVDYDPGRFHVRVRVLSAIDPQWRSQVLADGQPIGTGDVGTDAWYLSGDRAEALVAWVTKRANGALLDDYRFVVANGQRADYHWVQEASSYVRRVTGDGITTTSRFGRTRASYKPDMAEVDDGVVLSLSPLIGRDAQSLDLHIEMTVRKLLDTKAVKLDMPGKPRVEAPEMAYSRVEGRYALPPGRRILFGLGRMDGFDPKTRLFRLDDKSEVLLLLELRPDDANRIVPSSLAAR